MPTYANTWGNARFILAIVSLMAAAMALFAPASARAQMANGADLMHEMSIGSPDAPVVMHEYSSLTCPHCAAFHKDTLPLIKKAYVDTGKVRIVFHDFPLGNLALGAMMIVRCSGPERSLDFFDMLYETQADWSQAENPLAALQTLSRFYGMGADDVTQCLSNTELMNTIQLERDTASGLHGIDSTPTFMIEGTKVPGNLPFEDFQSVLDKALAAKGVK